MKVAILTMFNGLSNTYSLVNVVSEHIKMLLRDEIQVKMLVSEHCPDSERTGIFADERIEWIKIVNSENGQLFHWKTYHSEKDVIEESFFHQADIIAQDLVNRLKDVDVCMMHDILYQGVHLVHNVAVREAARQLPQVNFLSFTHSAPVKDSGGPYPISCMHEPMDHTTFIYPTQTGLKALSQQYNTSVSNCACVSNSVDVLLGMHEETRTISRYIDFTKSEILIVYPGRLTTAKRFHVIAELAGYIKTYGKKSVSVIFCDFSCADISPDTYKYIIRESGKKTGLSEEELVFTSDCGFKNGVKRETVFDLFALSNLFICPSYSESFGLTVIEAASRGNFLVLNEAVPALEEIGHILNAYFMRWSARNFGFDTQETYHPSEQLYYIEQVQKILHNMFENPVIKAKTLARIRYSNEWIYEHQLKPLLSNYSQMETS
ncbi:MAG: glycosyltransferase [Lachnospiraceae bacterium]